MFLFIRVFLVLSAAAGFALLTPPPPALAQSTEVLLDNPACRENPHSQDCICAEVMKFGFFPKDFNPDGTPVDSNGDNVLPVEKEDGVWVERVQIIDGGLPVVVEVKVLDENLSDLQFMTDDRYSQRCAMAYFRENHRRLWYFAVALGGSFTVLSLIWGGVVYMQNAASGVMELSRIRGMLARVLIGMVILACALLIWDGISGALFSGVDSWTHDRGVFYDLK